MTEQQEIKYKVFNSSNDGNGGSNSKLTEHNMIFCLVECLQIASHVDVAMHCRRVNQCKRKMAKKKATEKKVYIAAKAAAAAEVTTKIAKLK